MYLYKHLSEDLNVFFCHYTEATVPEVKLTLKANLEANVDTCNRLGDFVNEDELITAVQTMCPPSCNCTMGELKSTASGDNKCLVELPFTLDCGDYGLTRQMAKIWSMIEAPAAHNEDITVSSYPDITDIKQTCGEGRSLHMQDGEAKCSKLNIASLNFMYFSSQVQFICF